MTFLPAHPLSGLALAVGCLAISAVFMTLYASYRVTQEAGLDRLEDKYPKYRPLLAKVGLRWDTLRTSTLLCGVATSIAAVCLVLRALLPDMSWSLWPVWFAMVVLTVLLTLFVNILPHALSETYADLFSMRFLPLATVMSKLLFPLAWPLARLENALVHWTMAESDEEDRPSHEDEILFLVDQAPDAELEEEEREMIKSVFEMSDTVAREIMTPRVDLIGIPADLTVSESSARVSHSAHSRFPVYDQSLDSVDGYVHVKDILRLLSEKQGEKPIGTTVKPILRVPENTPINDLLKILRDAKEQIVLVFDEYRGTSGIVSMEDIIEELIGDIHDEYDNEQLVLQQRPDGSMVLDARMPVEDVNELMTVDIPVKEEYDSLGGYVFHALGRIPRPGESVNEATFRLVVQSGTTRRLHSIHVTKLTDDRLSQASKLQGT